MIATILTAADSWLVELEGDPSSAFPKLWDRIQAGETIDTVIVSLEGVAVASFPVLFNPNQVVAIHQHGF
jgi:hypothetical protein